MMIDHVITIVVTMISSSAVIGFFQYLIDRHDKKNGFKAQIMTEIQTIKRDITIMKGEADRNNAITRRARIVRFGDEISHGLEHTEESFKQVLGDIDEYERYCVSHPLFKNNQTVTTTQLIKESYKNRLTKNDFM
jgi:hypothetical protein